MPQAVDSNGGEIASSADLVDGRPQAVLGDIQHRPGRFAIPLDGGRQLRDQHGDVAGGCPVLILGLALVFVVFIENHGAGHTDEVRIWRDVLPAQCLNLGNAQRGEYQQRRRGVTGVLDSLHEHLDLIGRQEGPCGGRSGRERDIGEGFSPVAARTTLQTK